jgi:hypothetical protein
VHANARLREFVNCGHRRADIVHNYAAMLMPMHQLWNRINDDRSATFSFALFISEAALTYGLKGPKFPSVDRFRNRTLKQEWTLDGHGCAAGTTVPLVTYYYRLVPVRMANVMCVSHSVCVVF